VIIQLISTPDRPLVDLVVSPPMTSRPRVAAARNKRMTQKQNSSSSLLDLWMHMCLGAGTNERKHHRRSERTAHSRHIIGKAEK
jgi:hypothetical protein